MRDIDYSRLLREYCTLSKRNGLWTTASYTNFEIPRLPEAPRVLDLKSCKLEPRQQEFILCNTCNTSVQISRLTPRVSQRLTQKYSGYSPQPLKYCECKSLAVLVDHRLTPRIYTDSSWTLVTQPLGYERRYDSSELDYKYISKSLLDNLKRPEIHHKNLSRLHLKSNGIVLRDIGESAQLAFVISPKQTWRFHSDHMEHFIRYAYTYKLIIVTSYLIYLPSGIYLNNSHPIVKEILKPYWLKLVAPKDLEESLRVNQYLKELNQKLSEAFQLPVVTLREYPQQSIGYLPLINPRWAVTEDTIDQATINQLEKLKALTLRILRQISFCKSDIKLLSLWVRDNLHPRPLKVPPITSYLISKKLNPTYSPQLP